MSSNVDSSDVVVPVPSGFGEISKRRGSSSRSFGSSDRDAVNAETIGRVFIDRAKRAETLAAAVPAMRKVKQSTAQSRNESIKTKSKRGVPQTRMAPTPERALKGPIAAPKRGVIDAPFRAISIAEQLRDERELQAPKSRLTPDQLKQLHEKGKLDHDHRTSEGMYEAALRLRRHYEGSMIGTLKAQDLNRVIGLGSNDDTKEEAWVHHRQCFRTAVKMMGWFDHAPRRGNGRLVVAVVCQELAVYEAATLHIGSGRKEVILAAGMDRLREGLFALAEHWRSL